ncbi:SDR family NAD(P)-dependent oxidoreductase [Aquabacterium sp. J223]|uniref:SDR family NAD(P)-dependent oxidoreductase n=1 Tax=Aquabacterium sp. J223 TaxID=2898431 RepID=UPI0021ADEC69|nr:SDR family oxidoreductase [Aquabacterium sp. J223]UUX95309.1 SDR family oxidoreductase [Aquabacterium sp. J223]
MSSPTPRTVIVTGGGRGIPASVVQRFVDGGDRVAVVDLVMERARAVAEAVQRRGDRPGAAMAFSCDVRSWDSVSAMAESVRASMGTPEVLVNAAGSYFAYKMPHETTEAEWDSVVDSNLKGIFLCCKAVLPGMMEARSGRIINFASNAARSVATALGVEYTAAKTGVLGLTRHLAREYADYNILVNTLAPGPTDVERVKETTSEDFYAAIPKTIPLGRYARPEEIAAVAWFLASPDASFITGATLDVNGGIIMV